MKKNRKEKQAFVAEGHKLVGDLLGHFHCKLLVATPSWLEKHPDTEADEIIEVTQEELIRASLQKNPQDVLAIFTQPESVMDASVINHSLCLWAYIACLGRILPRPSTDFGVNWAMNQ